jgi:hypothetical protein
VIGVGSTGSYAAGLVRYLRAHAVEVVEVNWSHAHAHAGGAGATRSTPRWRPARRLAGRCDRRPEAHHRHRRVDPPAPRRARQCRQSAQHRAVPAHRPDRHGARRAARSALAAQDDTRQGHPLLAAAATHQPARRPAEAAKFALRSLARRITELDEEITALDRHSPRWSRQPRLAPPSCSGPLPATPASCSSPPGRTSTASPTTAPPRPSAAPARSRSPPGVQNVEYVADRIRETHRADHRLLEKRVRGRLSAYAKALESIAELPSKRRGGLSARLDHEVRHRRGELHAGPGRGVHRRGPQAGQVTARTEALSSAPAEEPGAPAPPRKPVRWAAQRVRLSTRDRTTRL